MIFVIKNKSYLIFNTINIFGYLSNYIKSEYNSFIDQYLLIKTNKYTKQNIILLHNIKKNQHLSIWKYIKTLLKTFTRNTIRKPDPEHNNKDDNVSSPLFF